jgi:hypothetical protein
MSHCTVAEVSGNRSRIFPFGAENGLVLNIERQ